MEDLYQSPNNIVKFLKEEERNKGKKMLERGNKRLRQQKREKSGDVKR